MKLSLPSPKADKERYDSTLERGLSRFPRRRDNYESYRVAERSLEPQFMPIRMDYEVSSRCNFRCTMCRVNDWPNGKRAEDMTLEDFRNSIDELYGLVEIKLQGLGEPLFNKDFFDMIRYASERDIWTRTTVNGSLLSVNNNYKKLIDSDPGEVQVSIDGASKRTFEQIRRGSCFETVREGAALLNEYAGSEGKSVTRGWTVVQKENVDELEEIVLQASELGFRRQTFSIVLSYWGVEDWKRKNRNADASDAFSQDRAERLIEIGKEKGVEVTFWDGSSKYSLHKGNKSLCDWIFERAYISSDMRIVPCCVISSPDIADYGDARRYEENWKSDRYRQFRLKHIEGNLPSYCIQCYEEASPGKILE